jgi:hypothetical protein
MTYGLSSPSGFEEVTMLVGLGFKPPCVANFKSNLFHVFLL